MAIKNKNNTDTSKYSEHSDTRKENGRNEKAAIVNKNNSKNHHLVNVNPASLTPSHREEPEAASDNGQNRLH